jgi:uncharacterized membrane protein
MIIFHIVFDLAYFYNWPLDYLQGFWYYQGKSSAILFMLVSGISSTLSGKPTRRGLIVFAAGMLITAATYLFNPSVYIRFGILHLLGFGMLIAPMMAKLPAWLLTVAGTALIFAGSWADGWTVSTFWLLPLGIKPAGFASLDYYPLLPWLGIVLFGMATGKLLYTNRQPLWPSAAASISVRVLSCLGRHSLLIYLIHQPILLLTFSLLLS